MASDHQRLQNDAAEINSTREKEGQPALFARHAVTTIPIAPERLMWA
jgi:hypothetical protein